MEVLILGICHEIFFFGKKRSKIRVHIIHGRALYTGKYGKSSPYLSLPVTHFPSFFYILFWFCSLLDLH